MAFEHWILVVLAYSVLYSAAQIILVINAPLFKHQDIIHHQKLNTHRNLDWHLSWHIVLPPKSSWCSYSVTGNVAIKPENENRQPKPVTLS